MALGSVSGDVSLLVRYAGVSLEIWLGLALAGGKGERVCVKYNTSSTEWSLRIKPVYIKYNIHTERMRSVAA